jgi:P27 family predicted phage terminase small subunit
VIKSLEEAGTLKKTDIAAITLLAELLGIASDAYAQFKSASNTAGQIGTIVKQPNGWPGPHPQWNVYTKSITQAKGLLAELGLTPSGRAKIKIESDAGELDPFADLDGGGQV